MSASYETKGKKCAVGCLFDTGEYTVKSKHKKLRKKIEKTAKKAIKAQDKADYLRDKEGALERILEAKEFYKANFK